MKNSTIAAAMNFLIPGAGLWYVGKPLLAAVNLLAATVLVVGITGTGGLSEQIHYVILAVAAGSAGLAHAVASDDD
ncbi:MAG: hypothetical protein ACYTGL_00035 [Planctomycetota bacterium]|jgi:hypothetical protein